MGVDEFMGEREFYTNFLDDHRTWIDGMIEYYSKLQKGDAEDEKWKQLVMVDYKSLEAARGHLEQIDKIKNKY